MNDIFNNQEDLHLSRDYCVICGSPDCYAECLAGEATPEDIMLIEGELFIQELLIDEEEDEEK